ncbi:translation initiation factor IF-2-like [Phacochoerus africanus]|uniref:translation initiation factor IF-2-like n=1 Tax=Phacochoerus africanus TaxID=41426 RepID=UPI001FDA56E8|nr:translation initiation factor IF-2-like [Phacochoerus africanus]
MIRGAETPAAGDALSRVAGVPLPRAPAAPAPLTHTHARRAHVRRPRLPAPSSSRRSRAALGAAGPFRAPAAPAPSPRRGLGGRSASGAAGEGRAGEAAAPGGLARPSGAPGCSRGAPCRAGGDLQAQPVPAALGRSTFEEPGGEPTHHRPLSTASSAELGEEGAAERQGTALVLVGSVVF